MKSFDFKAGSDAPETPPPRLIFKRKSGSTCELTISWAQEGAANVVTTRLRKGDADNPVEATFMSCGAPRRARSAPLSA